MRTYQQQRRIHLNAVRKLRRKGQKMRALAGTRAWRLVSQQLQVRQRLGSQFDWDTLIMCFGDVTDDVDWRTQVARLVRRIRQSLRAAAII